MPSLNEKFKVSEVVLVVEKTKIRLLNSTRQKQNHKARILTSGVKLRVFEHGLVFFAIFFQKTLRYYEV